MGATLQSPETHAGGASDEPPSPLTGEADFDSSADATTLSINEGRGSGNAAGDESPDAAGAVDVAAQPVTVTKANTPAVSAALRLPRIRTYPFDPDRDHALLISTRETRPRLAARQQP